MAISSVERILDIAVRDFDTGDCQVLHYGPPQGAITIDPTQYKAAGKTLRWYLGLMGETTPDVSPLSVDVADDKNYRVYRYDWVFGVSLPPLGELWWNWQKALRKVPSMVAQLIIMPADSRFAYTCVATNLNVLPPSRDTTTWWERNQEAVINYLKAGAKTAEIVHPGWITKTFSALSNSLEARGKWWTKNWFIYQFVDSTYQACAVEWQINSKVLEEYGPLLKGSLILAFHGGGDGDEKEDKAIRLLLRPQLGFSRRDPLSRVTPTSKLKEEEQVVLTISPRVIARTAGEGPA